MDLWLAARDARQEVSHQKSEIDTACERRPQAPNKPHAVLASMVCAAGAAVGFGTDRLASGILAAHRELCSSRGSKCPSCMRSDVGPRQPQRSHRNVTSREQPPQNQQASTRHGYPTCSCLSPSTSISGLRGWHVQHTQHINGTRASQQDFPNEQIGSQIGLQTLPHSVLHCPGSLKQGVQIGSHTESHVVRHVVPHAMNGAHSPTHGGGILHQHPGRTKQNSSTLERPINRPSAYDGLSSFVFQTLPGVPVTTDFTEPV